MGIFNVKNKNNNNNVDSEKTALILQLKQENNKLAEELMAFKQRERIIVDAIGLAKQKSQEYIEESKIRYALEMERLTQFSNKWQAYVTGLDRAAELGRKILETDAMLKTCKQELSKIIDEDFGTEYPPLKNFCNEKARLDDLNLPEFEENVNLTDGDLKDLILQLINK